MSHSLSRRRSAASRQHGRAYLYAALWVGWALLGLNAYLISGY